MLSSKLIKAKYCTISCIENKHKLDVILQKANKMFAEYTPININFFLEENLHECAIAARDISKEIKHPSYESLDNLFKSAIPLTSTILLLTSKAMGINDKKTIDKKIDKTGLLVNQRIVTEAMEMFTIAKLLHKNLQNLKDLTDENKVQVIQCNTWAVLIGWYIITFGFKSLAQIKNMEVFELITSSVRDLSEAEFIGTWVDAQNAPLPNKPRAFVTSSNYNCLENPGIRVTDANNWLGSALDEWTCRNLFNGANLLAKCCKGNIKLAGHDRQTQESAYVLGRNIFFIRQLSEEIKEIKNNDAFSIVSAPMLYHLEHDNKFYDKHFERCVSLEEIDYKNVKEIVLNGPGINKAFKLKKALFDETMEMLERLEKNPHADILCEIVNSI